MDEEVVHIRDGTNLITVKWSGVAELRTVQVQQAQPVEWDFAGGFTDEDEDQFLDDQPYIVSVVKVNLVPLTDEEKQKQLRKYLKSIKRKMKLGAPPQVPTYPEAMNFRENQSGVSSEVLLGHIISKDGLLPDPAKIDAILQMEALGDLKGVQRFMGAVGYYRRFIRDFAHIALPLFGLLQTDQAFEWSEDCQATFDLLRIALVFSPILAVPDWNKPFHVHTDASTFAIGAVLAQPGEGDQDHSIAYISGKLIPAEQNYMATERETLAIVWAASKFNHYLKANKVKFITDHRAIVDLVQKPNPVERLARWILALQELDFEVLYNPDKQNIVPDMLSRMSHILDRFTTLLDSWEDKFPDEPPIVQALQVPDRSSQDKWYEVLRTI
ncbi:hypothetical protein R1flu_027416 [Riccia fluitans]|uniref:Reverse transcriptase RNase H-like domain-containing protein n=1 Tax=Riccia fluitans TaxID=41844 RepID=A0ABD1XIQ7_9MARC